MQPRPRVLITNDDGVNSPGLLAAAQSIEPIADVCIMAPQRQQTAMGRAQSGHPETTFATQNFTIGGRSINAYSCDASPATVVGHGLNVFSDYIPQLVVSGINYGENLGSCITSSGTVGAAFEAATRGIPAIAMSLETPLGQHYDYTEQNWETAKHFLQYFAQIVLEKGMPEDVHVLKVDVPRCATPETPWKLTRLSTCSYYESTIHSPTVSSRLCDTVYSKEHAQEGNKETDVYAMCIDKIVAVTPLTLDFTSRGKFSAMEAWLTHPK